jgi:hypothetical protein
VVIAQRELNAVGEAHASRAVVLARGKRYREALADLNAFDAHYSDAYLPVPIRQYSEGIGWIAAQGWQRWPVSERRDLRLEIMAALPADAYPTQGEQFDSGWYR